MMGHPFSKFEKYIDTPLQPFIIPIVPARNADGTPTTLRPTSNLKQENLGKIPGLWYEDGWTGFGAWQNHRSKPSNLRAWQGWQAKTKTAIPIGFITADVHAGDVDSDKQEIVNKIVAIVSEHLGTSMVVRCRHGSTRCVLFFKHKDHTAPIRKFRIAFIDKEGDKHIFEFLAGGQQVVIEGPHAKGAMHGWLHGIGLVEGYDQLPEVTVEMVIACFSALAKWVEDEGFTLDKMSLPTRRDRAAAVSITDLMSPHIARDTDMLAKAIAVIDINDPRLADYDTWCALFRAMWAACGGDRQFYSGHILPWLEKNPANAAEDMEVKLASFTDSQLGAEYVYGWAAQFGFTEAINDFTITRTKEIFKDAVSTKDEGQSTQDSGLAGGSGSAPPSDGSGQGGGPIPFNDTHLALAKAYEHTHSDRRKFDVDIKDWLGYSAAAVWQPFHNVTEEISDLAELLSRQVLAGGNNGAARSRALESGGTFMTVRNILQGRSLMQVHDKEFDADPRLLNTPDFIINLETGDTYAHSPQFMMRQQTLVTPDLVAYGSSYRLGCPRFVNFLEIIANGRAWVIPFLQRWFGYCLTGKIGHQHFLFLQGLPGTGKSQLITILLTLMHTYATTLRSTWMMKNSDKRFDMVKVIGKRIGFGDETQKGATYDEERLSNVAGAKRLQAEVKGGEEFDFPNTIKLILAGNHRPNFISGEAGGLLRRMLLLEVTNKPIKELMKVEENFAELLVRTEGAAILMWAVEGAMLDFADTDHMIFNGLKQPMVEAAFTYSRENSLYWGWVEEHCEVGPDADMDLLEAFKHYLDHVWNTTHERCRDRRTDFRAALRAMLPNIEFLARTSGLHPNRVYIKGLGFRKINYPEGGNVVDINEKRSEKAGEGLEKV